MFSCKTQKTSLKTQSETQSISQKDIALTKYDSIQELTNRIINRLISEQLNIEIKQIKYDTDKPAITETGKSPIKEERNISVTKKAAVQEKESIQQQKEEVSTESKKDNSLLISKEKTNVKEKTSSSNNTKIITIITGIVLLIIVILFITRYIKSKLPI